MPKNHNGNGKGDQLPRFTIQMVEPLYTAIHSTAIRKGHKVYELMNKLLILGVKEWSKSQTSALKININAPVFDKARKMANLIE